MTAVESVLCVVCVHHGCVCVCMMDHRERPQRGQGGQPPPSGVWHPPSFQPPPLHFALCYHSSRSQSFSLTHNREAALSLCLCFPTAWQPEHLGTKVTVGSFWSDFPLRKLDICSTVPQCCHFFSNSPTVWLIREPQKANQTKHKWCFRTAFFCKSSLGQQPPSLTTATQNIFRRFTGLSYRTILYILHVKVKRHHTGVWRNATKKGHGVWRGLYRGHN